MLALALAATLGCREDAESPTGPAPGPAQALNTLSSTAPSFRQVSAGYSHTCGVTTENRVWCWGANFFGELGDGTFTDRPTPGPVAGGLSFRQVSAGTDNTCGVTLGNRIYCWGANTYGEVGDGTTTPRPAPVPVGGALRFLQVAVGGGHSCGVTLDYRAYCWGESLYGEIGDGTRTQRLRPVPVVGGHQFVQVSAGLLHTCGVTLTDRAYCWGSNGLGVLGGGPPGGLSLTPVAVVGGLQFRRVIAGFTHTCGVTPGNRGYCWGGNFYGELGDGTTTGRAAPVPVAGGLQLRQIDAVGQYHSCGVILGSRAYCWGLNRDGQLGDGTTIDHRRPVAIATGLLFRQVSAHYNHSCGVTLGNRAYCWGLNSDGQLGDGTTINSPVPVLVAGQAPDGLTDQVAVDGFDGEGGRE